MNFIKPYFLHHDPRGSILGIIQNKSWKEINFIKSKKGCVRGNHYHKKTLECFFIVSGKIQVLVKNLKNKKIKKFIAKENDIFIIKPFELHTFKILENAQWINMLSKPIKKESNDIFKLKESIL